MFARIHIKLSLIVYYINSNLRSDGGGGLLYIVLVALNACLKKMNFSKMNVSIIDFINDDPSLVIVVFYRYFFFSPHHSKSDRQKIRLNQKSVFFSCQDYKSTILN